MEAAPSRVGASVGFLGALQRYGNVSLYSLEVRKQYNGSGVVLLLKLPYPGCCFIAHFDVLLQ